MSAVAFRVLKMAKHGLNIFYIIFSLSGHFESSVVFRWHTAEDYYGQQNVVNCKLNERPNNPFSFNLTHI